MTYFERVETAIEFIENNLTEKVYLEQVAFEACLSKYHFLRIFSSIVGETVGDYVRKRRLTEAGRELISTKKSIFDIAIDYNFESQQSFTRSFKTHFGINPGEYRKNGKVRYVFERKQIDYKRLKHLTEGLTMKPEIKQVDEFKIIGMETKTTLKDNKISQLWWEFSQRMEEIPNRVEERIAYEVRKPDKNFDLTKFDEESEFTEMVGLKVTSFDDIPERMTSLVVPGGKYAVFTHKGAPVKLRETYEYIWRTWLPNSGMDVDMRYDFELYDERFKGPEDPETEIDIYIPVK